MEFEFLNTDQSNEIAFDFNPVDFSDIAFDIGEGFETRICKPKRCFMKESAVKYANAEKLAREISIKKDERVFVVVDGKFIFGDFIEAFIVEKNLHVKKMTIATLSMSQENIDSLINLIDGEYVDLLNLVVSDYFYSHERHNLIEYIYKNLDIDNKLQLAVGSCHTKICTIETHCGLKLVIHGSANLRSSSNIEQFMIEENECLFNFNDEFLTNIVEEFATINKSLRRTKLWQTVNK